MSAGTKTRRLIAFRIREARKLSGLSQAQVARRLSLHRPAISEIEAGNRRVAADELGKLAELFDVSLSWLAGEGAERADPTDDKLQLAARHLKNMKPDQLERLLTILAALNEKD